MPSVTASHFTRVVLLNRAAACAALPNEDRRRTDCGRRDEQRYASPMLSPSRMNFAAAPEKVTDLATAAHALVSSTSKEPTRPPVECVTHVGWPILAQPNVKKGR
jgi:hypothetical protein